MQAFDIQYSSNLLLPDGIAFGKAVSHGFGWQLSKKNSNK